MHRQETVGTSDVQPAPPRRSRYLRAHVGRRAYLLRGPGAIDWTDAALLGASAMVGGYVGARLARRFDPKRVERFVISFGVAASLILAYRVFSR